MGPSHTATFIKEQQVKTVGQAAVLADEYVVTHRSASYKDSAVGHGFLSVGSVKPEVKVNETESHDSKTVCHYCCKKRHVKADCYSVKNGKENQINLQTAALAASMVSVISNISSPQGCEKVPCYAYLPFITSGFVSLRRYLLKS